MEDNETTPFDFYETGVESLSESGHKINESFKCSRGLILPTKVEKDWPVPLRAVLYLAALLYCFYGIAIISDVFMCAIERITSCTKKVRVKPTEADIQAGKKIKYKEVLIWNASVANLTLMALGTSAPEILIAIIEVLGNNFESGELGPGCVVGSAAFNLMMIPTVCTLALADGKTNRIDNIGVFFVTSAWNVFGYIWLVIILLVISKDVIEVWEAVLTLFFFFCLLITAYIADTKVYLKWFKCCMPKPNVVAQEEMAVTHRKSAVADVFTFDLEAPAEKEAPDENENSHPEWHELTKQVKRAYPNMSDEEVAKIVAQRVQDDQPKSYLTHRVEAIRKISKSYRRDSRTIAIPTTPVTESIIKPDNPKLLIEFASRVYGITPTDVNEIKLTVVKRGTTQQSVPFRFETVSETAKKVTQFLPKSQTMIFEPNETEKTITVDLVEGAQWTPSDRFGVKLEVEDSESSQLKVDIGRCGRAVVEYIAGTPENEMSTVEFVSKSVDMKYNKNLIRLPVVRKGFIKNKVYVDWKTEYIDYGDSTATPNRGTVTFDVGEVEKYIDLPISEYKMGEHFITFFVRLTSMSETVVVGDNSTITINRVGFRRFFHKMDSLVAKMLQKLQPGSHSWKEQLHEYLNVNGGEISNATFSDYFWHLFSFPWKVLCAFVPPPIYLGGWLTFAVALGLIAFVTTLVYDIARIFGCLVDLDITVTAITFVAVGTSLPDTFASRIAVTKDKTADNTLGNVTGSNSMIVFVGLGLPWFIAAVYWEAKGKQFVVPAADLGFTVTIYILCTIIMFSALFTRRYMNCFGKAELGGPKKLSIICAVCFTLLWFAYVLLSSFNVYHYIPAGF